MFTLFRSVICFFMVYNKCMFLVILGFLFFANSVHAQNIEPDTITPINILKSSGAGFIQGWNYFQVQTNACNIGQILNEIQADGGSALEAKNIWLKKLDVWEPHPYSDTTKIESSDTLAFLSNQKFFFDLDPAVCARPDDKRQEEITKLRNPGGKNLLDFITNDFWQPVASELSKLITRYSLLTPDLTVSGKFKVGFLSFDDLEASIASLTDFITLKSGLIIKHNSIGTAIIPAGSTTLTIESPSAKLDAKVFVTPSEPVAISANISESGKIIIKIASPGDKDLRVNWWVVN